MRTNRRKRHWTIRLLRWTALIFYVVGGFVALVILLAASVVIAMDKHADSWAALDDLIGFTSHRPFWIVVLTGGALLTLADVGRRCIEWCVKD